MVSQHDSKEQIVVFNLAELPYDYDALEPYISAEIMRLHHSKHHQTYVNNLNLAFEKFQEAAVSNDVSGMIEVQGAIKFNGGGHINHEIFWSNLAAKNQGGGNPPEGEFLQEIEKEWGSFDIFKDIFSKVTVGVQGAGWGWLGFNKTSGRLEITTCPNQDPLITKGLIPLLGIDVWEHAYYLQYKNARLEYIKAIWEVVNWKNVEDRFKKARV
ncbi:MAG: Fe-Mn family superoxide dismutase [Chlamydiales bacterium]|jgi:Fe-Mn family superoxide dismutase